MQAPVPGARIRRALVEDLAFILATERLPGYERLVARSTEAEHRAAMTRADVRYLVGQRGEGSREGFAMLEGFGDPHQGVKLRRIAVASPGQGFGRPFTEAVIRHVFESTPSERLWLDVFVHNARARHVYAQVGLREDGLLRQAYLLEDGTRVDRVIMSILRDEWRARG